ncbi:MAG: glutamine-hydrolyzing GMP synthase [Bifidobacteriaceae bacterium]|nr:glutamine-hydrolyzing GMP synthase [Bifidobacteriaceae bacterium]
MTAPAVSAPPTPPAPADQAARPVLVVDFGAQYAQLIARRVREAHVYSEIVPHTWPAARVLAKHPAAIILSGGPASVTEPGAPQVDPALFTAGVPILGICYGFQAMAHALGGHVDRAAQGEYGHTDATLLDAQAVAEDSVLLHGSPAGQKVWMSHGVAVDTAPAGFRCLASTPGAPVAAFEDPARGLYGVQWHPEVKHTPLGQRLIENFLYRAAGLKPDWTPGSIAARLIDQVSRQIGPEAKAVCGLSGGVDSAVAAALVQRAIGDRLTCVFVDHGLLRADEREQVEQDFRQATGVRLVTVDARARFLGALAGVAEPEAKRKIIGREFIRVFEWAARRLVAAGPEALPEVIEAPLVGTETEPASDAATHQPTSPTRSAAGTGAKADDAGAPRGENVTGDYRFLVQGTLYPDVVESGGGDGAANIKSHHNVGGLPDDLAFSLVEPLRTLFKDEVRAVGTELGLPEAIVWRQPFPGPGLAIRVIGDITEERLATLRQADRIVREELSRAGLDREIWQCPVVLLAGVRSVGVQGDARTYGHPIVIRPVTSDDAMTADWARIPDEVLVKIAGRVTGEVDGINRVVLDVTSKPPGTIEWE